MRLWGWSENEAELNRAKEEAPDTFPSTGRTSSLDPYMQGVAHRNSVWSQLKFSESFGQVALRGEVEVADEWNVAHPAFSQAYFLGSTSSTTRTTAHRQRTSRCRGDVWWAERHLESIAGHY